MNSMEFFSRRFGTKLEGQLKFGDEVVDKYDCKAVVIRPPYRIGTELFVYVYYGQSISSAPAKNFTKTGRSFSKELYTIFYALGEVNKNET